MKNQNIYQLYRLPFKVFFGIFLLCMCAWSSRLIRTSPMIFSGEFMWLRTADWPVWVEHYSAALGLPSLFLSCGYWAVSRPDPAKCNERTPLQALLLPVLLGGIVVVLLVYGEAGHELAQLMLAKSSNFGQFVADNCVPTVTIQALSTCTSAYQWTVYKQGLANLAGTLTFLALLSISTWRLALENMRLGALAFGSSKP